MVLASIAALVVRNMPIQTMDADGNFASAFLALPQWLVIALSSVALFVVGAGGAATFAMVWCPAFEDLAGGVIAGCALCLVLTVLMVLTLGGMFGAGLIAALVCAVGAFCGFGAGASAF